MRAGKDARVGRGLFVRTISIDKSSHRRDFLRAIRFARAIFLSFFLLVFSFSSLLLFSVAVSFSSFLFHFLSLSLSLSFFFFFSKSRYAVTMFIVAETHAYVFTICASDRATPPFFSSVKPFRLHAFVSRFAKLLTDTASGRRDENRAVTELH